MAPEWEDPAGVPIDAFLFGGRRSTVVPLVHEALSWEHGVFLGSVMSSETTAAAAGDVGKLRRDPMAMLPFCGYDMAAYFAHWLEMGEREGADFPRIFYVNWFRKDEDGKFLWPGFGENSRVLAWVFRRCDDEADAVETPIGLVPAAGGLDTEGLDMSADDLASLLEVDPEDWKAELPLIHEHFATFGDRLPAAAARAAGRARAAARQRARRSGASSRLARGARELAGRRPTPASACPSCPEQAAVELPAAARGAGPVAPAEPDQPAHAVARRLRDHPAERRVSRAACSAGVVRSRGCRRRWPSRARRSRPACARRRGGA